MLKFFLESATTWHPSANLHKFMHKYVVQEKQVKTVQSLFNKLYDAISDAKHST